MPASTYSKPGLIRRLLGSNRPSATGYIQDISVGAPPGVSTSKAKLPARKQKAVVMQYEQGGYTFQRAGFREPEYDLLEIQKALDTDGYIRLSFDKHQELILKNGWKLIGQNQDAIQHVLTRLTEIAWAQNEPLERIIEKGVEDLVEGSNVFYVFARKEGGPKYKSRFGRTLYQISGIFSPPAHTMRPQLQFKKNNTGEIVEWQQYWDHGTPKKFNPYDVVHMAFRQKRGYVFGTPYCLPGLDDVLALRRIEELYEIISHKAAYPFFHYSVGSDEEPARGFDSNRSEIDDVKAELANMPFEGGLVTPHRHKIEVIGLGNKVYDLGPILAHFENRALSSLNLSQVDVGRGDTANRGTAKDMSRGLADRCTRFQTFFAYNFTFYVLDELVLEMGVNPTPENRVYLVFPTIDSEELRARNNHILALYQGDLLTETESRIELNRDPIQDAQRKDMYFERVTKPTNIIRAVDEPYTAEAKAAAKGMGSPASTTNRERPVNQAGRKSAKPSRPVNDSFMVSCKSLWDSSREQMSSSWMGVPSFIRSVEKEADKSAGSWLADGLERYVSERTPGRDLYIGKNIESSFVQDIIRPQLDDLRIKLVRALDEIGAEDRQLAMDSLWLIAEQQLEKLPVIGRNYGYVRVAQLEKHKQIHWVLKDGACPMCVERAAQPVRVGRLAYHELSTHQACMDILEVRESGADTKDSS